MAGVMVVETTEDGDPMHGFFARRLEKVYSSNQV
jgi:hypothetical protein